MTNPKPGYTGHTPYKKIGLFDSGVGGLSVLRQLSSALPGVDFVYLGDTARLPYGNRSPIEIASFVQEIVGFLTDFRLDALVMACNTSAALAQDVAVKYASAAGCEVFNLIEPIAHHIGQAGLSRVAILATQSTANSKAFTRALEAVNFGGKIVEVGCPKLVPLIESGRLGEPEIEDQLWTALQEYLLQVVGVEAIVLGCTHFPFVADRIEALIGGPLRAGFPLPVAILDPAVFLAQRMASLLDFEYAPDVVECRGKLNFACNNTRIFTTGSALVFSQTAKDCLGFDLGLVTELDVSLLVEGERERRAQRQAADAKDSEISFEVTPQELVKPAIASPFWQPK